MRKRPSPPPPPPFLKVRLCVASADAAFGACAPGMPRQVADEAAAPAQAAVRAPADTSWRTRLPPQFLSAFRSESPYGGWEGSQHLQVRPSPRTICCDGLAQVIRALPLRLQ